MSVTVQNVTDPTDLETVFAIRREVFVGEQNCPPELEWEFEDESNHFLATIGGEPGGACRWRKTDKGYKLERFAVLKKFRGKGVGHKAFQDGKKMSKFEKLLFKLLSGNADNNFSFDDLRNILLHFGFIERT